MIKFFRNFKINASTTQFLLRFRLNNSTFPQNFTKISFHFSSFLIFLEIFIFFGSLWVPLSPSLPSKSWCFSKILLMSSLFHIQEPSGFFSAPKILILLRHCSLNHKYTNKVILLEIFPNAWYVIKTNLVFWWSWRCNGGERWFNSSSKNENWGTW